MSDTKTGSFASPLFREMELRVDTDELARRRAAALAARAEAGDDAGTDDDDDLAPIPVAISSEKGVLRSDWMTGERYVEVLDHSPESVDLTYSRDGLPLVMSHRSWDGDAQHGLVTNIRVDDDRVLRGEVLMSNAQRSREIRDDILRGIRRKVSVGYVVGDDYEQTKGKDNEAPTRRFRSWMPIEVSIVPIPADYAGSGFGRSAEGASATTSPALEEAISRFRERHSSPSGDTATEPNIMPEGNNQAAPSVVATGNAPDTRVNEIVALAERHGFTDRIPAWVRSNKSVVEVSSEISDLLRERLAKPVQTVTGPELTDEQVRKFNFARALIAGTELEREAGVDVGFEREVAQEIRRQMPTSTGKGQGVLPFMLGKRAGVDSGTASTGGVFKFTQGGDFITLLRNKTAVMRLGATMLPGLTGPVTFPKALTAATAYWVGENPGSDVTASNITNSTVSLAFKTIQAATSVSRQALFSAASGNYALEQLIINDLAQVIGIAIDLAAINGSGSSNQPLGVLQNTSVGAATPLGSNGGTMAWGNWVDLETAIGDANADELGAMGYLTNTKQRGIAKKAGVLGNTASGVPIWTNAPGSMDGEVNGYRAVASNQVPRNLTKGTSTTVCSAVIFGAWNQLLIGQFGAGFETMIDPYSKKHQNMIEITAWNFVDVAIRYPDAFATIKDAL